MAKNLIEFSTYDADIVSYSNYDSTKTVLGPDIYTFSATSPADWYIAPNQTTFEDITQDTGVSNWGAIDVIPYIGNKQWIFCLKGYPTNTQNSPLEFAMYEFDKSTYTYSFIGEAKFGTVDGNVGSTLKQSLKASLDFYSQGTVQVTGTAVNGTGTNWIEGRIPIGARIGFGSTNSADITTWYRIADYPLMNNLPSRTNAVVLTQAIDPVTGKIYIGGDFTLWNGVTRNRIARLNTDGTLDTSFDPGLGFNNSVYRITLDASNKIYVGGLFTTYQSVSANRIIKLNTDGTKDTSFDNTTGFNTGYVIDIKIDSTGKLWTSGSFTTYKGATANFLTKLNADGTKDTSYPNTQNPNSNVFTIALDNNEHVYLGGQFTQIGATANNSRYIGKVFKTGGIDGSFNVGVAGASNAFDNLVHAIHYKSSTNTIIVGGAFGNWKGVANVGLTELTAGGTASISSASSQAVYTLKADSLGNIYSYAASQIITKRNINTLLVDPNFTPNIVYLTQTALFDNLALNLAQDRLYVISANLTVDSSFVCVETTTGTRDTTFLTSQDWKTQRINLNVSAGTFSAGTPYVIEDLKLFPTDSSFGTFMIQGVAKEDFTISPITTVTPTFNFMALNKGAYSIQFSSYNTTNGFQSQLLLNIPKNAFIDKISPSIHYLYFANSVGQVFRFNIKSPYITSLGLNSNGRIRFSTTQQVLITLSGINRTTGGALSTSGIGRFTIATMQSGSAQGVKSIYIDNSGIVQTPVDSLVNGQTPVYSYMPEIPPGSSNTYTAAGNVGSILFVSEIDRLIVLNLSSTAKSYITIYKTDFIQPNLSNTLFSRERFNNLSIENSFDLAFLVNGNQLQGSTSNTNAPKYPDTLGTGFLGSVTDGVLHLCRPLNTIQNNLYAVPISCEAEYVNFSNNCIISPKYNLPRVLSVSGLYLNTLKQYGTYRFNIPPEPILVDYRTSGIDDNTGTWTRFTNISNLNQELNCQVTITNLSIQFRFSFKIAGTTCLPNRIYGFSLIYEDDRTDSHYAPSISKSNLATRTFAWRQEQLWYGNIPDLKIRLYNSTNSSMVFYDTVTTSASGTWEYSTDGTTWLTWNSSADAIGNYIRYVADFIPVGIKLRVGLNKN